MYGDIRNVSRLSTCRVNWTHVSCSSEEIKKKMGDGGGTEEKTGNQILLKICYHYLSQQNSPYMESKFILIKNKLSADCKYIFKKCSFNF